MVTEIVIDTLLSLSNVVVTAPKISQTPYQELKGEQLQLVSTTTVADALKYFAGVQIKDYGGLGGVKTVNVRSMGAQHVGVFIDGIRITNAQNGQVDLGKYSLSNMESVSLYNGNKTEMLQSASEYASASTVYLQTRQPQTTGGNISYSNASFGTNRVQGHFDFRNIVSVDGEFCHSDGDYPFRYQSAYEDTTGIRRNSDITFFRIESSVFYKGFKGHLYHYSSERGIPGGVVRRLSDKFSNVAREWDNNTFAQLSKSVGFGKLATKFNLRYAYDYLNYNADYEENVSMHYNNHYTQQDVYASATASYPVIDNLSLSLSADGRWSDLVCDVAYFHYVYRIDLKSSFTARYSLKGANFSGTLLYTDVSDHTTKKADPLRRLTGMIHGSYTHGKFQMRCFWKSIFRAPTLNDLYYVQVGNRNLKPEYAKQLNIGADYTLTGSTFGTKIQIDAYYNRIDDRIVALPLKGTTNWTMLNFGKTRCYGLNGTLQLLYTTKNVSIDLLNTASFQDDRNRTDKESDAYNDLIPYSPKFSCSSVLSAQYRGWSGALSFMYVGKRYWLNENDLGDPLKAYTNLDLKISKTIRNFMISAEVNDICDNGYELIQRYPMPSRNFRFTIKYFFKNKAL